MRKQLGLYMSPSVAALCVFTVCGCNQNNSAGRTVSTTTTKSQEPVPAAARIPSVSNPPTSTVAFSQVSCGGSHTCAIKLDNSLARWGSKKHGQATAPPGTFSQISTGAVHSCAVRKDGSVICWGYDNKGQATVPSGMFSQVSAGGFQ